MKSCYDVIRMLYWFYVFLSSLLFHYWLQYLCKSLKKCAEIVLDSWKKICSPIVLMVQHPSIIVEKHPSFALLVPQQSSYLPQYSNISSLSKLSIPLCCVTGMCQSLSCQLITTTPFCLNMSMRNIISFTTFMTAMTGISHCALYQCPLLHLQLTMLGKTAYCEHQIPIIFKSPLAS